MSKSIVITGIGVLSSVAIGKELFWKSLFQGKSGFAPITLFDASAFGASMAGETPNFDPVSFLGKKGLRDLDRSTRLICAAAKLAIDDSKLEITENTTSAMGVAIGTMYGSLHSISQFDRTGLREGPHAVNPSHFPNTVMNSPASQVSIRFKVKGFNTTVSTGFCASVDAIAYGADFIKLGRAATVLAGGVEELCEETFLGLHSLGMLSGADGSPPLCCPFDARRNGSVLSEGAAILVLEEEQHALRKGTTPLARITGCASAFDPSASGDFKHAGQGLQTAIALALNNAALQPCDIDYICACANSTQGLDRMEAVTIKNIFGNQAAAIPVSSIKSMIGESCAASGALALAAAVGAIQNNCIPPTINHLEKDILCDLDIVPNTARKKELRNVLVTAVDPYGQNSAVIVSRCAR